MVKYLVIWTVINSWIVPCDHGPDVWYDEYGRRHESQAVTLELCWDSEEIQKEREFDTLEEAQEFIEEGKKSCEGKYDCPLKDWQLITKEVMPRDE